MARHRPRKNPRYRQRTPTMPAPFDRRSYRSQAKQFNSMSSLGKDLSTQKCVLAYRTEVGWKRIGKHDKATFMHRIKWALSQQVAHATGVLSSCRLKKEWKRTDLPRVPPPTPSRTAR